jgi:phosphopantothenoylcysteine decarboxylase / phosphopantothenate---cysteine ligase
MARILVGVSGGIAAYKAVELVRLATGAGHAVRVIQTPASERFVGRATFEGVTGAPVLTDEFERDPARGAFPGEPAPGHDPISHLELVRRCDAYVVAPASANTLAKLAQGLADNLLTSAALASTAPLVVAPAMNGNMWEHPATRANMDTLRARGATVVEPETGRLASRGEWGAGRLADPAKILAAVEEAIAGARSGSSGSGEAGSASGPAGSASPASSGPLAGLRVLVTAGGTREPIDSVRYVGNRSSGRMGLAVADEALERGADVTIVCANVTLPPPAGARVVEVETAAELEQAARTEFAQADVLVMAAAVSDFRPRAEDGKIGKLDRGDLTVAMEPTTDVLATLSDARRPDQTLIGFAAEHGDGAIERGRGKLERKRLDAVVVNDISRPEIGFDSTDNEVTIVTAAGDRHVPLGPKSAVAAAILDEVEALRTRSSAPSTLEGA